MCFSLNRSYSLYLVSKSNNVYTSLKCCINTNDSKNGHGLQALSKVYKVNHQLMFKILVSEWKVLKRCHSKVYVLKNLTFLFECSDFSDD